MLDALKKKLRKKLRKKTFADQLTDKVSELEKKAIKTTRYTSAQTRKAINAISKLSDETTQREGFLTKCKDSIADIKDKLKNNKGYSSIDDDEPDAEGESESESESEDEKQTCSSLKELFQFILKFLLDTIAKVKEYIKEMTSDADIANHLGVSSQRNEEEVSYHGDRKSTSIDYQYKRHREYGDSSVSRRSQTDYTTSKRRKPGVSRHSL